MSDQQQQPQIEKQEQPEANQEIGRKQEDQQKDQKEVESTPEEKQNE
jgi:hypothetical protein